MPSPFNTANIDSRFILASDLQGLFRDKTTGLPLRGGSVATKSENDRLTDKPLWKLTGTPGAYTYTALTNPLPLTAIGTYSDGGSNDIIPYWFPFEGDPTDNSSEVELYFVQVYDSNDVSQFTRIAWPNYAIASEDNINQISNFILNGQFIAHTNIWDTTENTSTIGTITQPITEIAAGGWTFERPSGSTATDNVTFQRYDSPITPGNQPTGNPRYAVNISNLGVGTGNAYKDLRIKFKDVNKFSSTTQKYTFAFTGSIETGTIPLQLILIKNFGTSGSATTETTLATFTLIGSPQIFQLSFTFGSNAGKSIPNDDDYIQLALRFPTNGAFSDALLTDFILAFGEIDLDIFQDETDESMIGNSASGGLPIPDPDGYDLYLPIVYSQNGFDFDRSQVGKIFPVPYSEFTIANGAAYPRPAELNCDGSQYPTFGYSSDGIPYKRLWNVLVENSNTFGLPMFGTGRDYVTCYNYDGVGSTLFNLVTNKQGAATAPANGAVSPTFTFGHITSGLVTHISGYTADNPAYNLIFRNVISGSVAPPSAGSSGTFTLNYLRPGQTSPLVNDIVAWLVSAIPAQGAVGSAGKFIDFSNTTTNFKMWFNIDSNNVAPAASGRTLIEVDVNSTWSTSKFVSVVAAAASGFLIYDVTCFAASAIPQSAYWTFSTITPLNYYVWYNIDGGGTDPALSSKIGIEVAISASWTATQVMGETFGTIDEQYFAVPDLRGMFIRGWDNGAGIDPNAISRFSLTQTDYDGDNIGTVEFDDFLSHQHYLNLSNATGTAASSDAVTAWSSGTSDATSNVGGSETRPINMYMNYVIKY